MRRKFFKLIGTGDHEGIAYNGTTMEHAHASGCKQARMSNRVDFVDNSVNRVICIDNAKRAMERLHHRTIERNGNAGT